MRAQTRAHLESYVAFLLAGHAAEELVCGEATAGAGGNEDSDLARASWLATRLESVYGLGRSGLVWLPAEGTRDLALHPDIQDAVRDTLQRLHAKTKALLADNRRSLDALAVALLEAGYLDRADICAVLAKTPLVAKEMTGSPPGQAGPGSLPARVGHSTSDSDDTVEGNAALDCEP